MNPHLKKFIVNTFKKPGKALDLGAGDFSDITELKKLGWETEGVDRKTGIDLEKYFSSKNKPFDLVYSNYLIHKIKNKKQFIQTIYDNLKVDGWFFLHTFDHSDANSQSELSRDYLHQLLTEQGFENIQIKLFDFYDDEEGHKHWHKILEATGQKS
jgi:cyclopropane fatty-acyl-phospholipid synthase-like methyltransferase